MNELIFWCIVIPGLLFMLIVGMLFTYRCFTGDKKHPYQPIDREYYEAYLGNKVDDYFIPPELPSDPDRLCIVLDGIWERVRNGGVGQSIDWLSYVPDEPPKSYEAIKSWEWLQDEKRRKGEME